MATERLEMIFKNQTDAKSRISVDNPREDLVEDDIKAVMDDIIARNLFSTKGGDIVAVAGARIITTEIQELTL